MDAYRAEACTCKVLLSGEAYNAQTIKSLKTESFELKIWLFTQFAQYCTPNPLITPAIILFMNNTRTGLVILTPNGLAVQQLPQTRLIMHKTTEASLDSLGK